MIHGYDLYIVPRDCEYRPTQERIEAVVRFLVDQLQITETFTVDDPRFSTAQVVGPSMLSLDGRLT